MRIERRQPGVETLAVLNEQVAEARTIRRAALATADWALRTGATSIELLDMLGALGIDRSCLTREPRIVDITLP